MRKQVDYVGKDTNEKGVVNCKEVKRLSML